MKALKKTLAAAAATALLSIGTSAQAGLIIDLFEGSTVAGTRQSVATSTLGATAYNEVGPRANIIGAYRDISITKTADEDSDANDGQSRLTIGGGIVQLSNDDGNKSVGLITWDGSNNVETNGVDVDGFGVTGIDLTFGGANALEAAVRSADQGFQYKIRVWDVDGNKSTLSASALFNVTPSMGITADYQYSWFNQATGSYVAPSPFGPFNYSILNEGTVDFTRIGALQLELYNENTESIDLSLGLIKTIPEPGTLALVGAALFGVAAVGRRRKA